MIEPKFRIILDPDKPGHYAYQPMKGWSDDGPPVGGFKTTKDASKAAKKRKS